MVDAPQKLVFSLSTDDDLVVGRWILSLKHPDGFSCWRCGNGKYREIRHRGCTWECQECGHQETARVRTLMEKSRIPLHSWLVLVQEWIKSGGQATVKELQWAAGVASYNSTWLASKRLSRTIPSALMQDTALTLEEKIKIALKSKSPATSEADTGLP